MEHRGDLFWALPWLCNPGFREAFAKLFLRKNMEIWSAASVPAVPATSPAEAKAPRRFCLLRHSSSHPLPALPMDPWPKKRRETFLWQSSDKNKDIQRFQKGEKKGEKNQEQDEGVASFDPWSNWWSHIFQIWRLPSARRPRSLPPSPIYQSWRVSAPGNEQRCFDDFSHQNMAGKSLNGHVSMGKPSINIYIYR